MKTLRLLLFLTSFILTGCESAEPDIVVVPKGFNGYIIVIFNQKNGELPAYYEGKKRMYLIPENGILKTQFKGNYGPREFTEFYYDRVAPENRIPAFAALGEVPTDTIVGFIGAVGTTEKKGNSKDLIEFAEFYVGEKADITWNQEQVEKLDIAKLADQ